MFFSRCDEPVTVSINVKVKDEDIDWTHVFTSGDELAVPGLGLTVKNVGEAGMFIKVKIESENGMLTLKVRLTQMRLYIYRQLEDEAETGRVEENRNQLVESIENTRQVSNLSSFPITSSLSCC